MMTHSAILNGVNEVLDRFLPAKSNLIVVGHSFGTIPLTWLLHCPELKHTIVQALLLDPVSILLASEPNTMVNFL
jgi:hypothetical protein